MSKENARGMQDDTISREQAVKAIEAEKIKHGNYLTSSYVGYEMAEKVVKQLPPIQSKLLQPWEVLVAQAVLSQPAEPKRGKWILDRSGAYCCSECMEPCASYVMMKPRDKFCKMCGSRNEVTE